MTNFIQLPLQFKIKEFLRKKKKKHYIIEGENNQILSKNPDNFRRLRVQIYGNDNIIDIRTSAGFVAAIYIGMPDCPVCGCRVIVENDATSNGIMIRLLENNSEVLINEDVMFGDDIKIYASDTHSILNERSQVTNIGRNITFGKHVWIGTGAAIAKNTEIAEGCVVGMKSVVCGKFTEPNCVIAGNPARVVKHNIRWDRERPNNLIKQQENTHA